MESLGMNVNTLGYEFYFTIRNPSGYSPLVCRCQRGAVRAGQIPQWNQWVTLGIAFPRNQRIMYTWTQGMKQKPRHPLQERYIVYPPQVDL